MLIISHTVSFLTKIKKARNKIKKINLHHAYIFPGLVLVFFKVKGSPYAIAERRVLELIPVLGSQPSGDVSHKPGGRLLLLSARPAVTSAT